MKIEFRSPTPEGAKWREAAIGRVRQARSWQSALDAAIRRVRSQVLTSLHRAVLRDGALSSAPAATPMAPRTLTLRHR